MKQLLFTTIFFLCAIQLYAQTECYIKYTYDNSGNRIKREYICAERDSVPIYFPDGTRKPQVLKIATNFEVSVYPNPSQGIYTIAFTQATKDAQLQIINYAGQQVLAMPLQPNTTEVNINNMANGIYTFVIKTPFGIENRRVIKIGD